MTVTAQLEPARAAAAPGGTSHFVLSVRNDGNEPASCTLHADTEVGGPVTFEPDSLSVAPGETSHVAVSVARAQVQSHAVVAGLAVIIAAT